MGIRLDWEVESESGSEAVAEDVAILEAQRRRQILTQRVWMIGAAVMIIGAALLALRARQVHGQRLDALNATVEAEALALRLGDKNRFMALQGASSSWRSEQGRNFDIFQNANPKITVTDEIVAMEINGDEARVSVRVIVGNEEKTAIWLYGYSAESGWRHIGTEAEPWARQVIEANGYRIEYEITDQETAAEIDEIMRGWWFSAQALSGMKEPLLVTIVLDDQKQRMVWEDKGETRLIVPSRDQDGGETKLFDPAFYRAFSMQLADRWMRYALDDREFAPEDSWIEAETQLWMRQIFDPQAIAPPVLSQLTAAFGIDFVPNLLLALREKPQISIELAMDQAMSTSAPGAVASGRLDRYFTRMLQAELLYEQAWGQADGWETTRLFSEQHRENVLRSSQTALASGRVDSESINVFDVELFGDVMWARVRFDYHDEIWQGADTITREMLIYVPFIRRNGYWVRTWPTDSDWGELIRMQNEWYSVSYYELDADRIDSNFAGNMWILYGEVVQDFGIEDRPYFDLSLSPNPMGSRTIEWSHDRITTSVEVPSIHNYWGTSDEDYQFHYNKAGQEIVKTIFEYKAVRINLPMLDNYISRAIMEWEMDRLGIEYPRWDMPAIVPPDAYLPDTLEGIWNVETWRGGRAEHAENTAQYIGARVLIDLLMERYGIEVLPEMIENTATNYDADTWLFESVGIRAAEIEAEWFARYREALIAQGFPNIVPQP